MASLNERAVSALDMMPLFAEHLSKGQQVKGLHFRGVSMLPMLREGRDTVELTAAPQRLNKYDLPVYLGHGGKYVMHRIVKVEKDHYVCMGDNTYAREHIKREQIAAVVCAFTRGKRRISVNHAGYRLYCRIWTAAIPLRLFVKRCLLWLRRHLK